MAKRATIGINPLDTIIPDPTAAERVKDAAPRPTVSEKEAGKLRLTVHLPAGLIDRVKNAVYWSPGVTLASFAELALTEAIERMEQERGGAFPQRREELKGGRPIK